MIESAQGKPAAVHVVSKNGVACAKYKYEVSPEDLNERRIGKLDEEEYAQYQTEQQQQERELLSRQELDMGFFAAWITQHERHKRLSITQELERRRRHRTYQSRKKRYASVCDEEMADAYGDDEETSSGYRFTHLPALINDLERVPRTQPMPQSKPNNRHFFNYDLHDSYGSVPSDSSHVAFF